MLDYLRAIYAFIMMVYDIVSTVIWWIREGIVFVFRMITACFGFLYDIFTADLGFLLPIAAVSLIVGCTLVVIGRR